MLEHKTTANRLSAGKLLVLSFAAHVYKEGNTLDAAISKALSVGRNVYWGYNFEAALSVFRITLLGTDVGKAVEWMVAKVKYKDPLDKVYYQEPRDNDFSASRNNWKIMANKNDELIHLILYTLVNTEAANDLVIKKIPPSVDN